MPDIIQGLPIAKCESGIDRESAYKIVKRREESPTLVIKEPPVHNHKVLDLERTFLQAAVKGAAIAFGSQIDRELMRGMLGSLSGTRKK